jgi:N-acetylneuraminic acid mutarotase
MKHSNRKGKNMKNKQTTNDRKQNFNWMLISLAVGALLGPASASLGAGDTWTQKADMPTARIGHSTVVVNGKIYAIGGYAAAGAPRLRTVEEYDPVTDTWTIKAPMPTARAGLSSGVVNGKIYAIGGGTVGTAFSVVEAYDPVTDTWTTKANMSAKKAFHSTSVVDGKIYAIGGSQGAWSNLRRTVYVYDPATDMWTKKADMPTERTFLSTSVVDGKIYAIGGALASRTFISTVEEYDPATDTWARKADMPTPRGLLCTVVVNGKIYAIGGGTTSVGFSSVEVYDPATDTWMIENDMPVTRAFLSTSASEVDGKIYVIGGSQSGGGGHPGLKTVYEYEPIPPLVVDFNGDGIVDSTDISMLVDYWQTDEPLYDIAPAPFGDGIVNVQDLTFLAEYLFQDVNDPTLMAHWALDEAEGNIALDAVSKNGDSDGYALGNPLWLPDGGIVNGAIQLDGVDDYIITAPVLNPSVGPFSVLAWIKGGVAGQTVISEPGGANWLSTDPSDGSLMTELKAPGRSGVPLLSQAVITDGDWHRIGFVWDGSYRTLYVDSIAAAQDTQKNLVDSNNGIYIGTGKAMEAGTYFSGLIDDVRIYNRAVRP